MSHNELLAQFQMVTGTADTVSRQFLSRAHWNLEAALSAYFDAGLDPPTEMIAPPPSALPPPPVQLELGELPVAALYDKRNKTRATLRGVRVRGLVQDLLAELRVEFRFHNATDNPIEALFRFKQDEVSSVKSYEILIGDQHLKAEVQEQEAARDTYDDAIAAGHTAFTLEKVEKEIGLLLASVGNLPPNEECIIIVTYVVELLMEDREAVLLLPVTSTPLLVSQEIASTTSSAAVSSSPSHDAAATLGFSPTDPVSGREIEHTDQLLRRDFSGLVMLLEINQSTPIARTHVVPQELEINVVQKQGADTALFFYSDSSLATAIRVRIDLTSPHEPRGLCEPAAAAGINATAVAFYPKIQLAEDVDLQTEIIFLVDRSGSMAGSRMRQVKNALQLFLRSLPEGTLFNIVSFGSRHEKIFPSSVRYDESTFVRARNAVERFDADMGGTEILQPLREILAQPQKPRYPRQLFCLTDGEVENTRDILQLIRNQSGSTRVFTFGVGADASKDLVQGMAREGRGRAEFVVSGERAETKVLQQLRRALQPAVENLRVQWLDESHQEVNNGSIETSPATLPPVFDGDQLILYALGTQRPVEVRLSGEIGDAPIEWQAPIQWRADAGASHLIGSMAAASRIRDLEISYDRQPLEATKQRIIDSSVQNGILSRFTAFVAVHESSAPVSGNLQQIEVGNELFAPPPPLPPAPVVPAKSRYGSIAYQDEQLDRIQAQVEETKRIASYAHQDLYQQLSRLEAVPCSASVDSTSFRSEAKYKSAGFGNVFEGIGDTISSLAGSVSNFFTTSLASKQSDLPQTIPTIGFPTTAPSSSASATPAPAPAPARFFRSNSRDSSLSDDRYSSAVGKSRKRAASKSKSHDKDTKQKVERERFFADDNEDDDEEEMELEEEGGSAFELIRSHSDDAPSIPSSGPVAANRASIPVARNMEQLIFQQSSSGAWPCAPNTAAAMGLELEAVLAKMPAQLQQTAGHEELWLTAAAIAFLRRFCAADEPQWGLLVGKATKWLRRTLASAGSEMSLEALLVEADRVFAE